jgi:hypothetical protein
LVSGTARLSKYNPELCRLSLVAAPAANLQQTLFFWLWHMLRRTAFAIRGGLAGKCSCPQRAIRIGQFDDGCYRTKAIDQAIGENSTPLFSIGLKFRHLALMLDANLARNA